MNYLNREKNRNVSKDRTNNYYQNKSQVLSREKVEYTLYINGKVWYKFLKKRKEKPWIKTLLTDYTEEEVFSGFIVNLKHKIQYFDKKLSKYTTKVIYLYTLFRDYIEFYQYYKNYDKRKRDFHEVIPGFKYQKPHYDIDISLKDALEYGHITTDNTVSDFIVLGESVKDLWLRRLLDNFHNTGVEIDIVNDVCMYTSHSPELESFFSSNGIIRSRSIATNNHDGSDPFDIIEIRENNTKKENNLNENDIIEIRENKRREEDKKDAHEETVEEKKNKDKKDDSEDIEDIADPQIKELVDEQLEELKISYHIIIDNYAHSSNIEARAFYNLCVDGFEYEKYIDSVYKSYQNFRIFGCKKLESNRKKKFNNKYFFEDELIKYNEKYLLKDEKVSVDIDKFMSIYSSRSSPTITSDSDSDIRFSPSIPTDNISDSVGVESNKKNEDNNKREDKNNKYLRKLRMLEISLVTFASHCKILPPYQLNTGLNRYHTIDNKLVDDSIVIMEKKFVKGEFEYLDTWNNIINLRRIKPSYCELCKKVHEHQNPFLKTINNRVYWHCRRYKGPGMLIGYTNVVNIDNINFGDTESIIANIKVDVEDSFDPFDISEPITGPGSGIQSYSTDTIKSTNTNSIVVKVDVEDSFDPFDISEPIVDPITGPDSSIESCSTDTITSSKSSPRVNSSPKTSSGVKTKINTNSNIIQKDSPKYQPAIIKDIDDYERSMSSTYITNNGTKNIMKPLISRNTLTELNKSILLKTPVNKEKSIRRRIIKKKS